MQIHLDSNAGVALGDTVCLISLLHDVPEPIEAFVDNRFNSYDNITKLLRIFDIPSSSVRVTLSESNGNFGGEWRLKLLSKYPKVRHINVFGKRFRIDKHKPKTTIGLACYPSLHDNSPNHKVRSIDYYTKVFNYFKSNGYDVITLDGGLHYIQEHGLEIKVLNLVENCSAVFGYEGGMAHLCHALQVPYFMLNWKMPSEHSWFEGFDAEANHISNSVYILNNDDEIFGWDKIRLGNMISELSNGRGSNNRIITGEITPEFTGGINTTINFKLGETIAYSRGGGMGISKAAEEFTHRFYANKFPNLNKE